MPNTELFQERISYQGKLAPLLKQVCSDYRLGNYQHHHVVPVGYEDLNVSLKASGGEFFVKMFASSRGMDEPQRYVDITTKAIQAGVNHPRLFESDKGYLNEITLGESTTKLCVMEFVNGQTFYELGAKPSREERKDLVRQAAKINSISFRPPYCYDSWAIVNFLREFETAKPHLVSSDLELLEPLVERFGLLRLDKLPHCLVHGDIITTNVIRDRQGKLFIIDFSVANFYPRIQELAVLLCDLFFEQNSPSSFPQNYKDALEEYQRIIPLTSGELAALPLYTQVAHAMHLICATREKAINNNDTAENESFLQMGRVGLAYTIDLWK